MRSAILLLLGLALLAAATRVPPITFADNWEKFHVEGGCFNDVYLFDELLDLDASIHYNTRVVVLGDFSLPAGDDEDHVAIYESEMITLTTFMQELSQLAFPVSIFEDCDEAAGFDYYRSLRVRYLSYLLLDGEETAFSSPQWYYLNHPTDNCVGSLVAEVADSMDATLEYDSDADYDTDDYVEGFVSFLTEQLVSVDGAMCAPDENCFLVFSRVNYDYFMAEEVVEIMNMFKMMGFQIITIDAADYQAAVATWVASEPYNRFSHMMDYEVFPRPQLVGSKLVQAVRGGRSACMSYGAHQIITYDGLGYTHNDLGDFVLAKDLFGRSFEVQIRNEPCYPNVANTACTTGVAVRISGKTIAFHYDQIDDLLAVTVDGELVTPGLLKYDEFEAYITRKYPVGFEIAVASPTDPLEDDYTPFTFVRAEFTYTGSVVVYPAPSLQYGLGGLCGTFDNCALNEFYTVDEHFVEDQKTFTDSWFVHGGASLFEQAKYLGAEAPFVLHAPFMPADWEPYEFDVEQVLDNDLATCVGYVDGPMYFSCLYIMQVSRYYSTEQLEEVLALFPSHYNLVDLAVWDVSAIVCSDVCLTEYTRIGGFSSAANCSSVCDSQMAVFAGLDFVFPSIETTSYELNIPVAENAFGAESFFYAPMGGDYLLRAKSYDCCQYSSAVEFVISVECEYQVLVTVPEEEVLITIDEFGIPLVELEAKLENYDAFSEGTLHVMWEFTDYPEGSVLPELMNANTLWPSFYPQSAGETRGDGVYTLQVIVTDGCSVSADEVVVSLQCYKRDYTIDSSDSDTMLFTCEESWTSCIFSETNVYLDQSCMAPVYAIPEDYVTEFPWTYSPFTWDFAVTRTDDTFLQITDPVYWSYYDAYYMQVYWEVPSGYPNQPLTDLSVDYTLEEHDDDYSYSEEQFLPFAAAGEVYNYAVQRGEAYTEFSEALDVTYEWVHGSYKTYRAIKSVECYIFAQVDDYKMTFWAQNAYPQLYAEYHEDVLTVPSLGYADAENDYEWLLSTGGVYDDILPYMEDNDYWSTGHCPGTYSIEITVDDPFACDDFTDTYTVDISCVRRPLPLPIFPCFEDIYYDYVEWDFPTACVLGYDSVVPAYRDMEFQWTVSSDTDTYGFENWNVISSTSMLDVCMYPISDYLKDDEYIVMTAMLSMTDHCQNVDADPVEVSFRCRDAPTVSLSGVVGSTVAMPNDYYDLSEVASASYISEEAEFYGALIFGWHAECDVPASVKEFMDAFGDAFEMEAACDFDTDYSNRTEPEIYFYAYVLPAEDDTTSYSATVSLYDQCSYSSASTDIAVECDTASDYNAWSLYVTVDETDYDQADIDELDGVITLESRSVEYITVYSDYSAVADVHAPDYRWFDEVGNNTWGFDTTDGYISSVDQVTIYPEDGDGSLGLIAYDGCNWEFLSFDYEWQCTPTNAFSNFAYDYADLWSVDKPEVLAINGNGNYVFSRVTESGTLDQSWATYGWHVTADVDFERSTSCSLVSTSLLETTFTITLSNCNSDKENTLTVALTATDDCGNVQAMNSVEIYLGCQYTFTVVAEEVDDTISWHNGQFEVACGFVDAQYPDVNHAVTDNFYWTKPWVSGQCNWPACTYYSYHFPYAALDGSSSTPEDSVFQTYFSNYTVVTEYSEISNGLVIKDDDDDFDWYLPTDTAFGEEYLVDFTIYHEKTSFLSQDAFTALMVDDTSFWEDFYTNPQWQEMGGCFRPDVAGTYTLLFEAEDHDWDTPSGCYIDPEQTYLTFTATCGDAPSAVVTAPGDDAVVGERFSFEAQVTDDNDDPEYLAYEWSVWYTQGGVKEDITDTVTNAHALEASFIPTKRGTHQYQLCVWDGCNGWACTAKTTFTVGCAEDSVVPEPPLDEDGNEIHWTQIVDFDGTGMLPIGSKVINDIAPEDQVAFDWKVIGFRPQFASWDDVYPDEESSVEDETDDKAWDFANGSAASAPLFVMLATLAFFVLF